MPDLRMRDLMSAGVIALSPQMTARAAFDSMTPEQVAVVLENGRPVSLITFGSLSVLTDPDRQLSECQDEFELPTVTRPDVPAEQAARAMLFDKSIRWYVVMNGGKIAGVVRPERLLQAVAHDGGPLATTLRTLGNPTMGELSGEPFTFPPGLCYRCKVDPSHRYEPGEVERRDAFGRALCRRDGAIMLAENPCGTA